MPLCYQQSVSSPGVPGAGSQPPYPHQTEQTHIYARAAVTQYTRELLFSSVVGLMHLVVCRIHPSIHAA